MIPALDKPKFLQISSNSSRPRDASGLSYIQACAESIGGNVPNSNHPESSLTPFLKESTDALSSLPSILGDPQASLPRRLCRGGSHPGEQVGTLKNMFCIRRFMVGGRRWRCPYGEDAVRRGEGGQCLSSVQAIHELFVPPLLSTSGTNPKQV